MAKPIHKLVFSAMGMLSALPGLAALGRCSGGACSSCLGCAGAGIFAIVALAVGKIMRTAKEDGNGMA